MNRIVTMYLDYAEDQAERRQPLYMRDWQEKLDAFLQFNRRELLEHPGRVSAELAQQLALTEYDKFHKQRLAREDDKADVEFESVAKTLEGRK